MKIKKRYIIIPIVIAILIVAIGAGIVLLDRISQKKQIEKDEKSGEYGTIRKIILHLKEEKMTSPQDEETKMVKEKAGEEVSVKVEIPPVITKEKQERPGTESKQEQQLKRKVAQYYGLEEACIEIWWEDDQGEMAVSASVRSDPDDPVYAISGKQQ